HWAGAVRRPLAPLPTTMKPSLLRARRRGFRPSRCEPERVRPDQTRLRGRLIDLRFRAAAPPSASWVGQTLLQRLPPAPPDRDRSRSRGPRDRAPPLGHGSPTARECPFGRAPPAATCATQSAQGYPGWRKARPTAAPKIRRREPGREPRAVLPL